MTDLTFYDKKQRPWLPRRLKQAAIVGHTTETSARIWVRAEREGRYVLVVSRRPIARTTAEPRVTGAARARRLGAGGPRVLREESLDLSFESDATGVMDFARLRPDTRYHYGLLRPAQGGEPAEWELGADTDLSFRTLPRAPRDWCFGLYSCHMPFDGDMGDRVDVSMWRLFERELAFAGAAFVVGGGDQVYSDGHGKVDIWRYLKSVLDRDPGEADMVSWYRDIYRGYWGFESLREVFARYPNYMIWDDHEIKDGWGSYRDDELADELNRVWRRDDRETNLRLARRMFAAAQRVYEEYQHSHNPPTDENVWDYAFAPCDADFYALDMRGHRSFEREAHRILGESQHERLLAWCEGLEAERSGPLFVVSSVPVVHLRDFVMDLADWLAILGNRDDVRDHWEHDSNHAEVSWLLETLFDAAERTGRPLVFLSGDVHVGTVFRIWSDAHPHVRAFQVTSSGITYAKLGDRTRAFLARATKQEGHVGNTRFRFQRHHVYSQKNCCIVHVRTDGEATRNIFVDLIGQAEDPALTESRRLDLLQLG